MSSVFSCDFAACLSAPAGDQQDGDDAGERVDAHAHAASNAQEKLSQRDHG